MDKSVSSLSAPLGRCEVPREPCERLRAQGEPPDGVWEGCHDGGRPRRMQGGSLALLHLSKVCPGTMAGGGTLSERFWGHSSLRPGQGAPPGRQGSEAVLVGRLVAWQPQAIPQAMMMFEETARGREAWVVRQDTPSRTTHWERGCRTAGITGTLGKRPGWNTGLAQRDHLP